MLASVTLACCPQGLVFGFNLLSYLLLLISFGLPYWFYSEIDIGTTTIVSHSLWFTSCFNDVCSDIDWSLSEDEGGAPGLLKASFAMHCISIATGLAWAIVNGLQLCGKVDAGACVTATAGIHWFVSQLCVMLFTIYVLDLMSDIQTDQTLFEFIGPSYHLMDTSATITIILFIMAICDCCGCCGGSGGGRGRGGGGGGGSYNGGGYNTGGKKQSQMSGKNMPQFSQYAQWS